ncbi:MAG TPA: aspartate dehydrogenase [Methanomicrobiales archaeon]|nr:aspartate dehydrogenase [Methanomicrobiales archaeon]
MIRVGLLGCGNVGRIIAEHQDGFEIVALFDKVRERADSLARSSGAKVSPDFESFIREDFDIVVEAASVAAVRLYGQPVLEQGKDLIILSVGALADDDFKEQMIETARSHGRKIHIPSGAILGLDNLKIGRISPIHKLLLRSTKSPQSLGIESDRRMLIFRGRANDCIRQFPRNINVAVALELAAGREAEVEIWLDPAVERNIHEVFAEGDFGDIYIRVNNVPSPDNPSTSYMAALSILTLLKNLNQPLIVGT